MKKILLDTNMFIYLEDNKVIEQKILTLTKRLFDSDEYKIVIHPKTIEECSKIKDNKKRNIFLSKISVYKEIKSPPKADKNFHSMLGFKNSHDIIDNELLFSVQRNCVHYLISNDKKMIKKAKKIGLDKRVLSIDEALEIFKENEVSKIRKPIFIDYKYLYELNINDPFFDSLKDDYDGFETWFASKQEKESMAYVSYQGEKITSFLMTKIENEEEDYSSFITPFEPGKRLKISTLKVADTGKRIGETFIKIIVREALKENVDEIYVTVFDKQEALIEMLENYGFEMKTKKKTLKANGNLELENVYVKSIKNKKEFYPFFKISNKKIYLVPIKEKFHKILFQESEKNVQLSLEDYLGTNTVSNSIKKAYICNSNNKDIEKGSILLFYTSEDKKAITSLGIVDAVFNNFNSFEELYCLVNKRTVYNESQLRTEFKNDSLVILFKLYYSFDKYVTYNFLISNNIIKGPIQRITKLKNPKDLIKILDECQMEKDVYLIWYKFLKIMII